MDGPKRWVNGDRASGVRTRANPGGTLTTKQICIALACLLTSGLAAPAGAKMIRGSDEADRIQGTGGSDRLYGEGKDDRIDAGGGNDFIDGGSGEDVISGGPGDDRILGQSGDDLIGGGPGNDNIVGGKGDDSIYAADGERDVVACGSGKEDRVIADRIDSVADDCETVVKLASGNVASAGDDEEPQAGRDGNQGPGQAGGGDGGGGGNQPLTDERDDSSSKQHAQDDGKGKPDRKEPKRGGDKDGAQDRSDTQDGDDEDVVAETVAGADEDDDDGMPIWLMVLIGLGVVALAALAARAIRRRGNSLATG